MTAKEAIQLVVEKKVPKGWSTSNTGIYGNFSRWPHEVDWYVKCPKCGAVHGSFKSMREAHAQRLCGSCNLKAIEGLKDEIANVNDPEHKTKPMAEIVGESSDNPERFLASVKPYHGDTDEEIGLRSYIDLLGVPESFRVSEQPNGWYVDAILGNGKARMHSGPFGAEQLLRFRKDWPVEWLNWPKHLDEAIEPGEFDPFNMPPAQEPGVPVPPEDDPLYAEPSDTKQEIDRLLLATWVDRALRYFAEEETVPLADITIDENWSERNGDYDPDNKDETRFFRANAGGAEWLIFKNDDEAEIYAKDIVRNNLETEPENFTQSWLRDFIDEDRLKEAIGDPYEDWEEEEVGNLDYEELLQKMVEEGYLDFDDPVFFKKNGDMRVETPARAKALDKIKDTYVEEKKPEPPDPWEHLESIYGEEEAQKKALEMAGFDLEKATQSAVSTDGWAHFVSGYDGKARDLDEGIVYCRTN